MTLETTISVCLCTYKRADQLAQCLQCLLVQSFTQRFEVVVTDNDADQSGELAVARFRDAFQQAGIPLKYLVEPIQNIALARNHGIKNASGRYIAFIDDDECATPCWLSNLFSAISATEADGVWGAVTPKIPKSFPSWMSRSTLFDRNNPTDGSVMQSHQLRSGNALIKRELLCLRDGPFDESLGKTGGEDSDLFNWILANRENTKFVYSADAEVFENIERKRQYIKWHLRRAYRGGWGFSRGLAQRHGVVKGFFLSAIRIIPSFIKTLGKALINIGNIRYAGLVVLMNIAGNLGKFGYFLGVKVEEYQG